MIRFSVLALAFAACTGADHLSTKGQTITCTTDPGTGVILRCAPGTPGSPAGTVTEGSGGSGTETGSGSGGSTCTDVDEDGDGEPHDVGVAKLAPETGDADGDGVPDSDDCDEHPGEDDSPEGADLPYDVKPQLGQTATPIADAFREENPGATVPTILGVTMDGGSWRLTELQAGTPFVVTQDDCNHVGNRDIGRDRVFVTWQNPGGATSTDHLDIRYCEPL